MDKKGEVWKLFLVLLPSVGATLIAVSRIMDARHHPFDVITGALLGTLCATIAYRQYFPSLFEPWKKGRAHPIREWGAEPTDPTIILDTNHRADPADLCVCTPPRFTVVNAHILRLALAAIVREDGTLDSLFTHCPGIAKTHRPGVWKVNAVAERGVSETSLRVAVAVLAVIRKDIPDCKR
ncbi:hypothetical protein BJY04DRAFT_222491 [Aspergillus karnatakaensis]|uniref:uncharacterized protein n=1 Tax=Aspergillus karnatakaensis TaxID=1810916 RepID=UPI003CCE5225